MVPIKRAPILATQKVSCSFIKKKKKTTKTQSATQRHQTNNITLLV